MSTITTLNSGDLITNSRAVINNNFAALNSDKLESSAVDVDTTLAANSDTKVPSQKAIKAYVDAKSAFSVSSESTTGTTHALITTANQRVVVWASGDISDGAAVARTLNLNYNGVPKHTLTLTIGAGTPRVGFTMMYTDTPGAATNNITVTNSGGTLANVVIMVMKFNV